MSLQLILGGSGSGKTTCLYDAVIQAAVLCAGAGAVYHAGAEECSRQTSGAWNDEY